MLGLIFTKSAMRDLREIDQTVQKRLFSKLDEVRAGKLPQVRLRGFDGSLYRIKLTRPQIRLVYKIDLDKQSVVVICVDGREQIYKRVP